MNDYLTGQATDLGVQSWIDRLLGRRPSGADVKLTLGAGGAEGRAEGPRRARRGAILALDPKTGALIASASAPTYDPATSTTGWRAAQRRPQSAPLLNRTTQGLYPPGSAFKVVTAAGGLDSGKVTPIDAVRRHRHLRGVRRQGHQLRRRGVRPQRLHPALTLSINTTFGKVGEPAGQRKRLVATCSASASTQTPPLPLPAGEVVPSGRYGKQGPAAARRLHGPARRGLGGVRPGEGAGHAAADGAGGRRRSQRRRDHEAVLRCSR